MTKSQKIISLIINLSIVVMEIIATFMSVTSQGKEMLQFYTVDSNLLSLVACSVFSVFLIRSLIKGDAEIPLWVKTIKYVATGCLTLTFIVVVTVLAPTGGADGFYNMLIREQMLFHHFLCPLLAIISFLFFEGGTAMKRAQIFIALIPTILYAALSVLLNILRVIEGPYPFLRVYEQAWFMSVIWCIIILGGAFLFDFMLALGNRKICCEKTTRK